MSQPPLDFSQLSSNIESTIMDRATNTGLVVTTHGFSVPMPLDPLMFGSSSKIARVTHVLRSNRVFMVTDRGDTIETDVPTASSPAPIDGRPVVYLDQGHWSQLANCLYAPERIVSDEERDGAQVLIALALERRIVLPMSMGHLIETAKWKNEDRRLDCTHLTEPRPKTTFFPHRKESSFASNSIGDK